MVEGMKIYKIYAQNVTRPRGKAIIEIDKEEAESLICEAVDDMINCGDIQADFDEDASDDVISAFYEKIYSDAQAHFDKYEHFDCGDFCVMVTDDPQRPNMAGYTTEF